MQHIFYFVFLACQTTDGVNITSAETKKMQSRFPEIDRRIQAIPLNKLEENKRKLKTGFKLFQVSTLILPKTLVGL